MTTESLPPENSSTGRSHSAAISRKIVIASSSSWAVDEGVVTVAELGTRPMVARFLSNPIGKVRYHSAATARPSRSL